MEPHLRVELRPRTAPAGDATQAARLNTVERLTNLGQIDEPAEGSINPDETVGWTARIGVQEFAIEAYGIQQTEAGGPLLSLVLLPQSLSIGDPATDAPPAQATPAAPQIASWGDNPQPDPRTGIPGWEPDKLGEQIAVNAAHLRTLDGRTIARLA